MLIGCRKYLVEREDVMVEQWKVKAIHVTVKSLMEYGNRVAGGRYLLKLLYNTGLGLHRGFNLEDSCN